MKEIKAVILCLAALFNMMNVDAASKCSYEKQVELNKTASGVKMTYEEADGVVDPSEYVPLEGFEDDPNAQLHYTYFKISLVNITEDIYVKVENSITEDVKFIEYKDTTNGTFTFDLNNIGNVTMFKYTIYSSTKTDCSNEILIKGTMTTPMYNRYHTDQKCEKIPDFSMCQKYVMTDFTYEDFRKKVDSYIEKQNKKEDKKEKKENEKFLNNITNFIKDNKIWFITGGGVLIVGGVVTSVIVIKKRRSRVI